MKINIKFKNEIGRESRIEYATQIDIDIDIKEELKGLKELFRSEGEECNQ